MPLRLRLLGPPRLEDATLSDLPLDRPASLAYYLVGRGDWVRRSELAYLYNPEAEESAAFNNLRKLIFRLKQYGWAEGLESDAVRVRLNLPSDVQEFKAALEEQNWARALEVYGGTFLEGVAFPDLSGYEAWLELEREELKRGWRGAVLEHARALEAASNLTEAESWLGRLLRADSLDEDAMQAMLRVLHALGQRTRALEVYEQFRANLKREMGVEPLESTRALVESLRQSQVTPVETPRPRHNLPTLTSRFVGRKRELGRLGRQLLDPECRLLTLVGLGGMGKTRLALELVGQHIENFADGVWLVPLVGVASPDLLVSSIASALGLTFSGPTDPKPQLVNYLRGKQLLLLLDNFEHLIEGGLLLEELLTQASGLKLLVTSRVALELSGEWLYDLEGLSYPPTNTEEDLDGFDAVRLFINRAERLSSTFIANAANLGAIAELARRVQGMPLALELAATWVRGLSVSELVAQLSQSFDLLQTTQQDVPERHRNLQAVLDYTWQFLSPSEQTVLAKLSVFRGGFTLDAAQAVAGAHLGLLLRFINQALVRRGEDGRYDMHELVRQYAALHLAGDPRTAAFNQFCDYFLGFLVAQGKNIRSQIQKDTVQKCRAEINNIFSAFDYLATHSEVAQLKQALIEFYLMIEIMGLFTAGIERIDFVLGAMNSRSTQDSSLVGRLLALKSYFLIRMGKQEASKVCSHQSAALLETEGPTDYLGVAYFSLGLGLLLYGSHADAILTFEKALKIFEGTGNKSEMCRTLSRIAATYKNLDRLTESDQHYQRALELSIEAGDLSERGLILNSYGVNFESSGRIEEAIKLYEQSLEICNQTGHLRGKSAALTNLGHVYERLGEFQKAKDYYEQSIEIKSVLGEPVAISISMTNLADVLYVLGEEDKGHRLNLKCIDLTLQAQALMYTARVVWSFGRFFAMKNQLDKGLLLAFFLLQTQESEQWVHDEVREYIAQHSKSIEPTLLDQLADQAKGLNFQQVAEWLKQPGTL